MNLLVFLRRSVCFIGMAWLTWPHHKVAAELAAYRLDAPYDLHTALTWFIFAAIFLLTIVMVRRGMNICVAVEPRFWHVCCVAAVQVSLAYCEEKWTSEEAIQAAETSWLIWILAVHLVMLELWGFSAQSLNVIDEDQMKPIVDEKA